MSAGELQRNSGRSRFERAAIRSAATVVEYNKGRCSETLRRTVVMICRRNRITAPRDVETVLKLAGILTARFEQALVNVASDLEQGRN